LSEEFPTEEDEQEELFTAEEKALEYLVENYMFANYQTVFKYLQSCIRKGELSTDQAVNVWKQFKDIRNQQLNP